MAENLSKNSENKKSKDICLWIIMQAMTLDFYQSLNFKPVVPPKSNRKSPWIFDKVLYKSRNKVERLFRKIKRFRRIFTRYDKLDSIFLFFIYFAFIFDSLFRVNRP
ncbi:MAG: transposase, partial [Clostridia bacterium]|nr:transposase [Clostridia bacterium]